jgi:hypothetical protein
MLLAVAVPDVVPKDLLHVKLKLPLCLLNTTPQRHMGELHQIVILISGEDTESASCTGHFTHRKKAHGTHWMRLDGPHDQSI